MKICIYVSDGRIPDFNKIALQVKQNELNFFWCKDYNTAIQNIHLQSWLENDIILYLDHDLGLDKTGYDIAKYIVENQIPLLGFKCYSMNPIGKQGIEHLLFHYGYKII